MKRWDTDYDYLKFFLTGLYHLLIKVFELKIVGSINDKISAVSVGYLI